jgi:hypothetical protein
MCSTVPVGTAGGAAGAACAWREVAVRRDAAERKRESFWIFMGWDVREKATGMSIEEMNPNHGISKMRTAFRSGFGIALLLTWTITASPQQQATFSRPPTSFSAEDDKFPGAVPLPACVGRRLARDKDVMHLLEYEDLSTKELPASWFTASAQELARGGGTLLVVMGAGLNRGANINSFWIFRLRGQSCELLLSTGAHDLMILETKTAGLPNVKTISMTAVSSAQSVFRFDGRKYRLAQSKSGPTGE